ncbi:MAG: helix-turn-helix transcriptional regulator [Candidatus Thiodiazotropha endolucinida]
MPFCHITLKTRKTRSYPSLEDCHTLGDHLKQVRLKRGLRQSDVASRLGINPWTLRNWEHNRTEPRVQYYPAVMAFLGYCPCQRGDTLGMKMMLHRTHRGLSQKAFAGIVGVDSGSVSRRERDQRVPTRIALIMKQFFNI